jgi:hypothetical protein
VGNSIVLLAVHDQLKPSELFAVWTIEALRGGSAVITAEGLSRRTYPLSWMVLFRTN